MKTLLIYPPSVLAPGVTVAWSGPPLGTAMLGAALETTGLASEILDARGEGLVTEGVLEPGVEFHRLSRAVCRKNRLSSPFAPGTCTLGLGFEQILDHVKSSVPDVVGISMPCCALQPVVRHIAGLVKGVDPGIRVVAGGCYPSASPADVLSCGSVDYVVMGEGEGSFVELLRCIEEDRFTDVSRVPGVGFMDRFVGLVLNPPVLIDDLDALPFPAYDRLPVEKYFKASPLGRTLAMTTSRGCRVEGRSRGRVSSSPRRFRARSPGSVIAEMDRMAREYALEGISFEDENMTLDAGRAKEIFRLIAGQDYGLKLHAGAFHAGPLDREMLDLMSRAGFETVWISPGPETGVKVERSGLEDLVGAVRLIIAAGLNPGASFTIGMPGDTTADVLDTMECARELKGLGVESFRVSIAARTDAHARDALDRAGEIAWDDFHCPGSGLSAEGFDTEEIEKLEKLTDELRAELNGRESAA